MKSLLKGIARRLGYDVIRYRAVTDPDVIRRIQLFDHFNIDLVLDVGANIGQYGCLLRKAGYSGKIVSFEPLSSAYSELQHVIASDPAWTAVNMALGAENGTAEINIAGNSFSSSILDMLPEHEMAAPDSSYIGKESIIVRTLDSEFENHASRDESVFMKIDTQGFERQVLEGGENVLGQVCGIQLEMSLVPLYSGETLFRDMWDLLKSKGYTLMSLEPGWSDPGTGRLLQVDGVFFRE